MANTFFGFNTSLNDHSERLGSSPEDIEGLEAEEEYDALNDETFGGLGGESDDWEVQHEELAEIAESSRLRDDIIDMDAILNFNIDEMDELELEDFAYFNPKSKNNHQQQQKKYQRVPNHVGHPPAPPPQQHQQQAGLPKLQTVEELERMLLNQSKSPAQTIRHAQLQPPPFLQPQHREMPRFHPGFQPMHGPPHPMWQHHQHHHHGPMPPPPPGMMRVGPPGGGGGPRVPPPPHLMPPGGGGGPAPPPGFMNHPFAGPGPGYHMNPHYNFPAPPRPPSNLMGGPNRPGQYNNRPLPQQQQQQHHHQQRSRPDYPENRDEYAGLMNNREKQWLLNIQLLQVNTGTPYFDDYYYTVFKERQARNKENIPENRNNNNPRYHNNRYQQQHQHQQQHNHRDGNVGHHQQHGGGGRNSGQDNRQQQQDASQNPLNKKVYTPLVFENSLGKLQFGSITAPRKIIDMDIITLEKDADSTMNTRDSRKTKQLLLELEALYTLILKAEDLKNPVAVSNSEKLLELKQKQRIREMDAAPTPEQKREILKLLQEESIAPVENQSDLLAKIVSALLQDEKLISFVGIRKGKVLLLRVLPQLNDSYVNQLVEIWIKLLLSIPLVGRRDTIGDNILPRFHPQFKRFIHFIHMDQILEIVTSLIEVIKLDNNRSTPLGHQSKPPLYFIVSNKFGISALATILQRVDTMLSTLTDTQTSGWSNFMTNLIETLSLVGTTIPFPIEPLTEQQLNRLGAKLQPDKLQLLEKTFVDSN